MVKLVNQTSFSSVMKQKNISLFAATDIRVLFGLSQTAAVQLLHRYAKRKFIIRLKRGLYTLADMALPELFIAGKLYSPSYISRELALSYHRVIPETVYEITSVTSKATRRFEKLGKIFSYRTVKKAAFTGYSAEKQKGFSFYIADPEKALVDTHYFRLLDGVQPLSRFRKELIHPAKALQYAALFGNEKLTGMIKTILQ